MSASLCRATSTASRGLGELLAPEGKPDLVEAEQPRLLADRAVRRPAVATPRPSPASRRRRRSSPETAPYPHWRCDRRGGPGADACAPSGRAGRPVSASAGCGPWAAREDRSPIGDDDLARPDLPAEPDPVQPRLGRRVSTDPRECARDPGAVASVRLIRNSACDSRARRAASSARSDWSATSRPITIPTNRRRRVQPLRGVLDDEREPRCDEEPVVQQEPDDRGGDRGTVPSTTATPRRQPGRSATRRRPRGRPFDEGDGEGREGNSASAPTTAALTAWRRRPLTKRADGTRLKPTAPSDRTPR